MKGILQLIRQVGPKNVMLVHGETKKMKSLKRKIECELALKCFTPTNGTYLKIEPWKYIPIQIDRKHIYPSQYLEDNVKPKEKYRQIDEIKGHLIISKNQEMTNFGGGGNEFDVQFVNDKTDGNVCDLLNVSKHEVIFDLFCCFTPKHLLKNKNNVKASLMWLYDQIKRNLCHDYDVKMKEDCIEIYQHVPNEEEDEEKSMGFGGGDGKKLEKDNDGNVICDYRGLKCVTMYIEKASKQQMVRKLNEGKKDKKKLVVDESKKMDVDDDGNDENKKKEDEHGHGHEHDDGLTVRIIYPHNLTDLASLVQSLINMTCDSYC